MTLIRIALLALAALFLVPVAVSATLYWLRASGDWRLADRSSAGLLPPAEAKLGALSDEWSAGEKSMATRKASGACINAIAPALPELWGGSADLAESNLTEIDGADSFVRRAHYFTCPLPHVFSLRRTAWLLASRSFLMESAT